MDKRIKKKPNIYENTGKYPLMIAMKWHGDPLGYGAIMDLTISIMPGESVDLNYLGLTKKKKPLKSF